VCLCGAALGLILYKEFVKAVRKSGGGDKSPRDTKKGKKSSHSDDEEEGPAKKGPTLKLTRTLTMVLTSQLPPSKKLRGAFEGIDRSGNGRVSRRDFRTALEDVKVDLQV
jgi:Ca2+-binding EF-hand superfamily protein